MKSYFDVHSLPVQMILSFIGVIIITAAAVGIPAVWLIRNQLERQAWSQVDQGRRATLALYDARNNELEDLAMLTAQRPTLRELLSQGNWDEIGDYLGTLKTGAGLDLVVICDSSHEIIASPDSFLSMDPCEMWSDGEYQILIRKTPLQLWLTATYPIENIESSTAMVMVGTMLNDEFAHQLHEQTGLEHIIWAGEFPVATSLTSGIINLDTLSLQEIYPSINEKDDYGVFELKGQPYFSAFADLDGDSIRTEVALSVADIAATQSRIMWIMAGSILSVAVVGSIIGAILARRISQPLVRLANTADAFRKGDLHSTVAVDAQVREVDQVAQALESARIDLLDTLTNLEREKAWVNHLVESIVEGIMTLDHDGHITYFSHGAERLTGWSREEVLGRSCDEVFLLPELSAPFSQHIPTPDSKKKIVVELADGNRATLAVTKARLTPSDAGDFQRVLVFRDVSEEEMIHRILGDFLANIAHEFRTPLSAAAASIELLIDQAPELSDTELKELLDSLHLGILSLQNLVDNLLESASIEAGRFRISPRTSDIAEIIGKAVWTMQPLLEKYGQHLIAELPLDIPVVYADARRVEQVLVNLLSNASKYGPADEEININVMVDHQWVTVQVADRGPGVSHEQRKHVFQRFMYPGSLSDSAKVGAGLGLSVVKAVVEAHGGKVGVEDRPGGGSIFWFTLPLAEEE
jgi:two-component system phosphate regulon sensor histidine kinase PhoR